MKNKNYLSDLGEKKRVFQASNVQISQRTKTKIIFLVWRKNFLVSSERYGSYFILTQLKKQFGNVSTYYKSLKNSLGVLCLFVGEFNLNQLCNLYYSFINYMVKTF
jgi:hypothetical protein